MSSSPYRLPRRLPVFFLLDTSEHMRGTFEVTMQQGLLIVRHELGQRSRVKHSVQLATITFGEQVTFSALASLNVFAPPTWQARGRCALRPALSSLVEALNFDIILSRPERPGDYPPLVFLILGSQPTDTWAAEQAALQAFTGNQRPLTIALVARPELLKLTQGVCQHILLLDPAKGESITNFFYWAAQSILRIYEGCENASTVIDFPPLPYGVVRPRF